MFTPLEPRDVHVVINPVDTISSVIAQSNSTFHGTCTKSALPELPEELECLILLDEFYPRFDTFEIWTSLSEELKEKIPVRLLQRMLLRRDWWAYNMDTDAYEGNIGSNPCKAGSKPVPEVEPKQNTMSKKPPVTNSDAEPQPEVPVDIPAEPQAEPAEAAPTSMLWSIFGPLLSMLSSIFWVLLSSGLSGIELIFFSE